MNKEKEIEAHSKKPFEIGDSINVSIPYQLEQSPSKKRNFAPIQRDCAQRGFANYSNLTTAQLPENADDRTTIASFLMLNFSGVPLSREHLEYVQSIKF
jgi:hypothetical protein